MESQIQELGQQADQVLSYAAWAGPIGLVLLGVALWFGGRRVARPLGATAGLLVGAGVAYLIAQERGQSAVMLAGTIGALGGALLAWVLFRIWMGAALAMVLALALPVGGLALQDVAPPPWVCDTQGQSDHESSAAPLLERLRDGVTTSESADVAPGASPSERLKAVLGEQVRDATMSWWDRQRTEMNLWWESLATTQRGSAIVLAGLGAVVGVLIGLIWPYTSAAIQSAMIGTVLALAGLSRLTTADGAAAVGDVLPKTPAQMVSLVGLITVVGVALQWTVWRRHADK